MDLQLSTIKINLLFLKFIIFIIFLEYNINCKTIAIINSLSPESMGSLDNEFLMANDILKLLKNSSFLDAKSSDIYDLFNNISIKFIIGSIDSSLCQFVYHLTIIYRKPFITWSCEEVLINYNNKNYLFTSPYYHRAHNNPSDHKLTPNYFYRIVPSFQATLKQILLWLNSYNLKAIFYSFYNNNCNEIILNVETFMSLNTDFRLNLIENCNNITNEQFKSLPKSVIFFIEINCTIINTWNIIWESSFLKIYSLRNNNNYYHIYTINTRKSFIASDERKTTEQYLMDSFNYIPYLDPFTSEWITFNSNGTNITMISDGLRISFDCIVLLDSIIIWYKEQVKMINFNNNTKDQFNCSNWYHLNIYNEHSNVLFNPMKLMQVIFLFLIVLSLALFVFWVSKTIKKHSKSEEEAKNILIDISQINKLDTSKPEYNNEIVSLSILEDINALTIHRSTIQHLKDLRDIKHEHLNKFYGLLSNNKPTEPCYLIWKYCSRGSLYHILQKNIARFDCCFILSLLTDIIKGMKYLHNCKINVHGFLNSYNCAVENNWIVKITNFGKSQIYYYEKKTFTPPILWVAPELLAIDNDPLHIQPKKSTKAYINCLSQATQLGDIYSFAIIISELLTNNRPYSMYNMIIDDLLIAIKHENLRPLIIKSNDIPQELINLMEKCWSKNPEDRPSFDYMLAAFNKIIRDYGSDTILDKLDKYPLDFEEAVLSTIEELEKERQKSEKLLQRMLPASVIERLRSGLPVEPEKFAHSTVYFSDIVGFTTISAYSRPIEIINLLNELYNLFDDIISGYNVYKVETIGDCYMVVSGLPSRNEDHTTQIADMALHILHKCTQFKIKHMPQIPLKMRIGINSGSIVAGVVGSTMPRYCLFGDTVNIASRLESSGKANLIHIGKKTEKNLKKSGGYHIKYRGEIYLKGRGKQPTYWLLGKDGFGKDFSEPEDDEGDNHGFENYDIFDSFTHLSSSSPSPMSNQASCSSIISIP